MRTNVRIEARERGKLIEVREVHNIWVDRGREYLAEMVALSLTDPDVPERSDRIHYMSVGIGGNKQSSSLATTPPLTTQYPAGSDPLSTSGVEYNEDFPFIWDGTNHNPITTLERPAKFTGNAGAYGADGLDRWLIDDPSFFNTHLTPTELTAHGVINGSSNQVSHTVHRPVVPLSEAGLHTDEAAVLPTTGTFAFNPLMAYVTFDTILITNTVVLEFIWSVKF